MIQCICSEIELRKGYLSGEHIETIYLGGGTPSLISNAELASIFDAIHKNYSIGNELEVTLEANPENLTSQVLADFHGLGVNRLSVGIQSFHDPYLKYLNRSHDANQAIQAIDRIVASQIEQFSLDLIFGIKPDDHDIWISDIEKALEFGPPHLSVYNLTIEEKTVFGHRKKKDALEIVSEEQNAKHFEVADEILTGHGFEHYEVSNYCKDQLYARHNSSYWKGEKYLGVGPGAHSFDQVNRQNNISNNSLYIRSIRSGKIPQTEEILTTTDKINERIMTGLRTQWGCDIQVLRETYGYDLLSEKKREVETFEKAGLMIVNANTIKLTLKGQLLTDSISVELMA